jgi:pseudouridylate synthase
MIRRTTPISVALETTLLAHGVPADSAMPLYEDLAAIIADAGAHPAPVAVINGHPTVGLTPDELRDLLAADNLPKLNTANLGLALARGRSGATTVSATMELAAAAGVAVFATGGIGGVHHGYGKSLDISADLAALARFPVAVVASGVKAILDVVSTREALETLGVPVVGYQTDAFPAFYFRESAATVDERFDDPAELAAFCRAETNRTGRGILVCNPIPEADAIEPGDWFRWLEEARRRAADAGAAGRDVTPAILAALHDVSGGRTLEANIALVKANARLAARLAAAGAR